MASPIGGCRHWEIRFEKDGRALTDDGLAAEIGPGPVTDVVVFSHGWNTSESSARDLGNGLFEMAVAELAPSRRLSTGLVTVLWPSLLFPEDEPAADGPVITNPGDAQGAEGPPPIRPPSGEPSTGAELAVALSPAFPGRHSELARIGQLLDERPQDAGRLAELHRLATGLVTTPNDAPEDAGEVAACGAPTSVVLDAMAGLAPRAGDAQGLGVFDTLWDGARELVRVLSYYEMKNRAGTIGRRGLGPLLARLQGLRPDLRVHLVGHSFGARLVAFSLLGLPAAPATPVRSLLLVQGAFSHFSFADPMPIDGARRGALAGVADRVDGPLLATFTAADRAVGWWYPNASRLSREDDQAADVPGYRWGGMGFDAFQQARTVDQRLEPPGTPYGWKAGTFYRLDATHVVNRQLSWFAGAHSDIRKPEIAWAAVTAAGLADG